MKKLLTIFLTFILIVTSAVCMVGCSNTNTDGVDDAPSTEAGNVIQNSSIFSISLFSSPVTQSENYVAKTITAEVLPLDAPNRGVTWTVFWLDNQEGEEAKVEDYVIVYEALEGAGSLIVDVRCYKPFENSVIGIKATTWVGNLSATCEVRYIGEPSTFEIVHDDGVSVEKDGLWNNEEIIMLYSPNTYNFDLTLDNIFNNVTDNYIPNYSILVECFGTYVVSKSDYYDNITSITCPLYCFDTTDTSGKIGVDVGESYSFPFLSYNLVSGQLKLSASRSFTSFVFGEGYNYYSFDGFVEDGAPYCKITITDTNTNLSDSVCFRVRSSVESVAVDGDLTF